MTSSPLRLLVIGAHPDDAEYKAGGLAALYRQAGHKVRFLSVTDGSAGHQRERGRALAQRRLAEAATSAAVLGLNYEIWDLPDGRLEPTLDARERMIRSIRAFHPDLVLTHRPNDYHPDHRVTSQLVQDAAYMLTVPAICDDVPHLPRDPVIAYLSDHFTKPYPFSPDVLVDISAAWEQKVSMLEAHTSQFFEWLPYNQGILDDVPDSESARRAWLSAEMKHLSRKLADQHREALVATYGADKGGALTLIEAFEACEYGAPLDDEAISRLFPFVPAKSRGS